MPQATKDYGGRNRGFRHHVRKLLMLVLTRKNRESIVIGRAKDLEVILEITILEIEGGRVRLGFQADSRMPIHRREVWDRICNGHSSPTESSVVTGSRVS